MHKLSPHTSFNLQYSMEENSGGAHKEAIKGVSSQFPVPPFLCSSVLFCQSQQQNGQSRNKMGWGKKGGRKKNNRLAFRVPRGPLSSIRNERAAKHQPCSLSSPSPSVSPGSFVHEESDIMVLWEGEREGGRRSRKEGRWGKLEDEEELVGWRLWRLEKERGVQALRHVGEVYIGMVKEGNGGGGVVVKKDTKARRESLNDKRSGQLGSGRQGPKGAAG